MSADAQIVDLVFRSASGASLSSIAPGEKLDLGTYEATPKTRERAQEALRALGFEIVGPATAFGVSISGSRERVESVFGEEPLAVPESLEKWIESAEVPPTGRFFGP